MASFILYPQLSLSPHPFTCCHPTCNFTRAYPTGSEMFTNLLSGVYVSIVYFFSSDIGEDWPSSSSDSEGNAEDGTTADQYHTANSIHVPSDNIPETEHTVHQIIQLLQQMGGSHNIDRGTILDRDFLPCKCCTGTMIDV